MGATLTVQDLFKLILFLLGIGALTYLIMILNNFNKILKTARETVEANQKEIDLTIKQLPEISVNVNAITKETKIALENIEPELSGLLKNVNSISNRVEGIAGVIDDTTHKVGDTVFNVSDSISETADAFRFNARNVNEYLEIIREVFDFIKMAIQKHWVIKEPKPWVLFELFIKLLIIIQILLY